MVLCYLQIADRQYDTKGQSEHEREKKSADGNGVVSIMCSGVYPDKTALCGHHLSGYSGREGIADWKGEEFDMIKNERIAIYVLTQISTYRTLRHSKGCLDFRHNIN